MSRAGLQRYVPVAVVLIRVLLGAVFILSGFAKMVDLWGSVFKIEEYLAAWGMHVPRTVVLMGSTLLSVGEFLLGALLLLGCYRRVVPWLMTAVMAVMLPLTLYLWIANPVSDCGCFGDLLHLSNGATLAKNVVIVLLLVPLWRLNRRVAGCFTPHTQWLVGAFLTLYGLIIGFIGYNVQPPVDFRSYAVGTSLLPSEEDSEGDAEYMFIYEKGGERREFTVDSLPDDSWTYVDRRLIGGDEQMQQSQLVINDGEDDVTEAVLTEAPRTVIVSIPEPRRINPGQTYLINEMHSRLAEQGVPMTVVMPPDSSARGGYEDIAMASYPIYTAEPTVLKELVRGPIGVVVVDDGVITSKQTFGAFSLYGFSLTERFDPATWLRRLTLMLAGLLVVVFLFDAGIIRRPWRKKAKADSV